ncbi:MAG: cytochrome c [Rhodospirillaceae bacterium]|jgi:mono/diheme cytochrome c family protein|nr:cytochrome c [Rhodospirillaceae bacterium]MBT3808253.1 cytochrome c [Rhodospirillaceae bacterium]MBT3930612.1 cytochrome c [Rhodospirillaceae bacterium]MBT4771584.1 cytochrome c [Rhodospirillaceae bacterium]MBT5357826.1 cytochrome c [Rhodospirillaceae bacterium]
MKRGLFAAALAGLAIFLTAGTVFLSTGETVPSEIITVREGDAERGAYVARMSGCIACHTNEAAGGALLAGGPPLQTQFGTFFGPNITPDKPHGLGNWTLDDFARALRLGISPNGKPYYPAFPFGFYTKLTDQDVADLWAAFQTVPGIPSPSKPQEISFPFNQRWTLRGWKRLFFNPGVFQPQPGESDLWNRGKYIVTGPAHCGACHTPRNPLGGRNAEQALHGAGELPGNERSPQITAEALREKGWTETNLAFGLRFGTKPNGDVVGGSMGEVVRDGTSWLTDEDLEAIAHYLLNNPKQD